MKNIEKVTINWNSCLFLAFGCFYFVKKCGIMGKIAGKKKDV